MVSTVVRVRELDRSMQFYCDVFSCRVIVHEADIAPLLTPKGFEIYLRQKYEIRDRGAGVLGVRHLMWATDSRTDLQRITERLRGYDSTAFSHTVQNDDIGGDRPRRMQDDRGLPKPQPATAHADCRATSRLNPALALADPLDAAKRDCVAQTPRSDTRSPHTDSSATTLAPTT